MPRLQHLDCWVNICCDGKRTSEFRNRDLSQAHYSASDAPHISKDAAYAELDIDVPFSIMVGFKKFFDHGGRSVVIRVFIDGENTHNEIVETWRLPILRKSWIHEISNIKYRYAWKWIEARPYLRPLQFDGPDEMPNSVDARTIDRYRALGTIRVECYWAQSTPLEKGWASVTGHQPMPVIKVTEGVVKGRCIGHVVDYREAAIESGPLMVDDTELLNDSPFFDALILNRTREQLIALDIISESQGLKRQPAKRYNPPSAQEDPPANRSINLTEPGVGLEAQDGPAIDVKIAPQLHLPVSPQRSSGKAAKPVLREVTNQDLGRKVQKSGFKRGFEEMEGSPVARRTKRLCGDKENLDSVLALGAAYDSDPPSN